MNKTFILLFITLVFCHSGFGQEICDNAIDDDADGLIDLNDPDCDCNNLIEFSQIPNPSFEDTVCCPTGEGMLTCAVAWVQASGATSDYYNSCGLTSFSFDGALPPEYPLPGGGEGFIGLYNFLSGYREYVGTCTSGPLLAGVSYSLNFQTAYSFGDEDYLDIQLYGTPICTDLPWIGVTCPDGIGAWTLLGNEIVTYEMDGSWVSVTISFTPIVDLNAIAFGGPCSSLGDTDGSYYYFDELILLPTETMGYIEEVGGWCSEDLILTAITDDPGGSWQWYKDGVALVGEIFDIFEPFPYGTGEFTAVYTYADGCKQVHYSTPSIPTAAFSTSNSCYGISTEFVNLSDVIDGELTEWNWSFGDGDLSDLENPSHFYTSAGIYSVELILFSEDESCNDTAHIDVTISSKPVPDFEIEGSNVTRVADTWYSCADYELLFNDLTTIDGAVSFASWEWFFGDDFTSADQNPSHIYDSVGVYEITLIVIAENGCIDSIKKNLSLSQVIADFSVNEACIGEEMFFSDHSYAESGSVIVDWQWCFEDDTDTSYLSSPIHLYEKSGTYDVQLFVENDLGCQDSIQQLVYINPLPNVNFYASNNPTDYFHTELRLVMLAPNPTSSYLWSMPSATPSSSTSYAFVDIVYPSFVKEDYTTSLIETTEYGCVDTAVVIIQILEDQMIFAPTCFTPNGDPFNNDWGVYVEGFNLNEFRLTIYNRWGEIIWQANDPTDRWNGTYLDGVLVPIGTYVWYVKTRDQINDEVFEYNGFITVLK